MAKINLQAFKDFTKSTYFGSFILFLCLVVSLTIANSPLAEGFEHVLKYQFGYESEMIHLKYSTEGWINDGLMAIFFLMVGLEIKRELLEGELSSFKKAVLPILSAFGGAIVPAIIYACINFGTDKIHGWGIPMATDIAFALAVISMLGKIVPSSLKVFLAALAIADDLFAILVIAIFYSTSLNWMNLGIGVAIVALLAIFNKVGIKNLWFYIIPGIFVWYFIHHSGIHATIAGVMVAFTIPTNATDAASPLEKLEHALANPVNFFIIPLFALINTNITYETGMLAGLHSKLGLGIILGLVIGKVAGILLTCLICTKLKFATLPTFANWWHMVGVGLLGGIGFTMSIFVSLLSFKNADFINEAKFSILVASLIAGVLGFNFLKRVSKKYPNPELTQEN